VKKSAGCGFALILIVLLFQFVRARMAVASGSLLFFRPLLEKAISGVSSVEELGPFVLSAIYFLENQEPGSSSTMGRSLGGVSTWSWVQSEAACRSYLSTASSSEASGYRKKAEHCDKLPLGSVIGVGAPACLQAVPFATGPRSARTREALEGRQAELTRLRSGGRAAGLLLAGKCHET
jgi:hypothetical protein